MLRATATDWPTRLFCLILSVLPLHASPVGAAPTGEVQPAATGRNVASALLLDATRAGERIVAVGERGIVLYSDDDGGSWLQAAVPVDPTLTSVVFADAEHGWITGHDATILATTDGGLTWQVQFRDPDLDVPLLAMYFADMNTGMAVGGRGNMFRTRDGGKTWVNEVLLTGDEFDGHLFGIGKADSGSLFIASERGVLFRSDDAGVTWQELASPYNGSFFGLAFPGHGRIVAYAMLGNIAVSSDNGDSWRMVPTGTDKSLMSGTVMADGTLVIAGLDGAVLVSHDAGETFLSMPQADRRKVSRLLPTRDGGWLAFGDGGVHRIMLNIN